MGHLSKIRRYERKFLHIDSIIAMGHLNSINGTPNRTPLILQFGSFILSLLNYLKQPNTVYIPVFQQFNTIKKAPHFCEASYLVVPPGLEPGTT